MKRLAESELVGNDLKKTKVLSVREAIDVDDLEGIKSTLLSQLNRVDKLSSEEMELLDYIIKKGALKCLEFFIENIKIRPVNLEELGKTLVGKAIQEDKLDIIKYLTLEGNISFNTLNQKNPFLHFACKKGNVEVVQLLLEQNPDLINALSPQGATALHMACNYGNTEVARLLLKEKPNLINAVGPQGATALHVACGKGHTEVARLLLDQNPDLINARAAIGLTALHLACEEGHTEVAKLLLKKNPDLINALTHNGWTTLHMVCEKGHTELAKLLLKKSPNLINALSTDNLTALHYACGSAQTELVKLLLEKNPNLINLTSASYGTALHIAGLWLEDNDDKKHLEYEVIEFLVKTGADLNIKNQSGETPLQLAFYRLDFKSMGFLLEQGADTEIILGNGSTIISTVADFEFVEDGAPKFANWEDKNVDEAKVKCVKLLLVNGAKCIGLKVKSTDENLKGLIKVGEAIQSLFISEKVEIVSSEEIKKILSTIDDCYVFVKSAIVGFMTRHGITDNYLNKIQTCEFLTDDIFSHLGYEISQSFNNTSENMGYLDWELLQLIHSSAPVLPNDLLQSVGDDLNISFNESCIQSSEYQKNVLFFENNAKYKEPGYCVRELANTKSDIPGVTLLNYFMLLEPKILEGVQDILTKNILIDMRYKLSQIINKHAYHLENNSIMDQINKIIVEREEALNMPQEAGEGERANTDLEPLYLEEVDAVQVDNDLEAVEITGGPSNLYQA